MAAMDRLSSLPDSIIHHILSFLTVEDSAPTSILSKRFRYQWTFNPNLCFSENFFNLEAMDKCIKQYRGSQLSKFCIELLSFKAELPKVHQWLDFVVSRNVRDLTIRGAWFTVPDALFSLETLESVTLSNCYLYRPKNIKCCDSLRCLSLYNVNEYDGAIEEILRKCRKIESLELNTTSKTECVNFSVVLPELRKIYVYLMCKVFIVRAPKLEELEVDGHIVKMDIENTPRLKYVHFAFQQGRKVPSMDVVDLGSYMQYIANVKALVLTEQVLKLYTEYCSRGSRVVFQNLKVLHIQDVNGIDTVYSFVRFFQDCPVLEELKMHFWKTEMNGYLVDVDIKLMLELDDYFFNHLKVVNILNFSYSLKNMLLLKLLWKGAPILEKVNLHLDEMGQDEKELILRLAKISPDATIKLYDHSQLHMFFEDVGGAPSLYRLPILRF
ncbi:hypothetical protein ACHQM5_000251 [Ranunculus cassubicifolius]